MSEKELDYKIRQLIFEIVNTTLYWGARKQVENGEQKYAESLIKAERGLKELLNIETHEHPQTNIFK
jgi:hypothetical protein